jgi:hypothetical protein
MAWSLFRMGFGSCPRAASKVVMAGWAGGPVRGGVREKWRSGEVEKWRSGEVEKWRSGEVEMWRSGEVEKWRSGEVEKWAVGSGVVEKWEDDASRGFLLSV